MAAEEGVHGRLRSHTSRGMYPPWFHPPIPPRTMRHVGIGVRYPFRPSRRIVPGMITSLATVTDGASPA